MGDMRKTAVDSTVGPQSGAVIDFDEALLSACRPELRAELLAEAALLMQAFAPEGRAQQLQSMARTLSLGLQDGGPRDRERSRLLAAALRHLANDATG